MPNQKKHKEIVAYVQAIDGRPLMPCRSHGRVNRMLKSGKARIVSVQPFTIRLTYELEEEHVDPLVLGVDPGRNNIGLCTILEDGTVMHAADIETRNGEIKLLMQKRSMNRRSKRNIRRQKKRRHSEVRLVFRNTKMKKRPFEVIVAEKKNYPLADELQGMYGNGTHEKFEIVWERRLPQCEEDVILHGIRNKEARFCNRKRPTGWLTPTANQLLQTHINAINKVMKILPISDIVLEINKFDIAGMDSPKWHGDDYCHGMLFGIPGDSHEQKVHNAVSELQDGHCLFCKKGIEHYHHVIPKSKGGQDSVMNEVGLCKKHHDEVHKSEEKYERLKEKKSKLNSKNGFLSVVNQIMPYLMQYLEEKLYPWINIHYTKGYITKDIREQFKLPKEHYVDAWCIAASAIEPQNLKDPAFTSDNTFHMMQFRRHNRAATQRVESRKYRDADGKVVAANRKKAISATPTGKESAQTTDSLAEYREKLVMQYLGKTIDGATPDELSLALKKAERDISKLKVTPSQHISNNLNRILPGALYKNDETGELFVMRAQCHNGEYIYQAYAGEKAVKLSLKYWNSAKKKAEKNNQDCTAIQERIDRAEAKLPKEKSIAVSRLRLLQHNTGLVYIPIHI